MDTERSVASRSLTGLSLALEHSSEAVECGQALFADIQALITDRECAEDAAKVLLKVDKQRAGTVLLSDSMLSVESAVAHHILRALSDVQINVPRERILRFIEQFQATELTYPQDCAMAEALKLLGQRRNREDRPLLEEMTFHPVERVSKGAAQGLLLSLGADGYMERIWKREEHSGCDSFSVPQRHVHAVFLCDMDVTNGGFSQYFVNTSGDYWPAAVVAFEAIGSLARQKVEQDAVALFGVPSPSTDRTARQKQLSKLIRRDEDCFEPLDERYFAAGDVVEVLLARYVAGNIEEFR